MAYDFGGGGIYYQTLILSFCSSINVDELFSRSTESDRRRDPVPRFAYGPHIPMLHSLYDGGLRVSIRAVQVSIILACLGH